jgi:hypothetical protein
MSLQVLAYNFKRVIRISGFVKAMRAIKVAGAWFDAVNATSCGFNCWVR